jgi:uncharacterized protein
MKILFFIVHPSKYYLFRHTINNLKKEGHEVEVLIVAKDILEDLIKAEGWSYRNIIPGGRRSKKLPSILATIYFSLLTLVKLFTHTLFRRYDLFITDDLLVLIGAIKRTPTLFFTDDDLSVVKEVYPLFALSSAIVSPNCTDVGKFTHKKIGHNSYHELAYLHPKYFQPDINKIHQFNSDESKYFIIRLVSLTATHDKGKQGINNQRIRELISLLESYGKVFITSERELPGEFEKYRIKIAPRDIAHALYFAEMFIGDSQTMTSEAALLGTPSIRFNDFVGKIRSMEEKQHKYGLTIGFTTNQFNDMIIKIKELLEDKNLKSLWRDRKEKMLLQTDDMNEVISSSINKFVDVGNIVKAAHAESK